MTQVQAKSLAESLARQFGGDAEFEPVNEKGRYRFAIETNRFNGVPHLQRQDEIWDFVNEVVPREETLDISLILAFAPADLAGVE
jgi:hypothetical protein